MRRRILTVLALTALAAAANLVSTVSAGSLAQNQRVMLVQKQRAGAPTGTFNFYALSSGPLKLDSGTYTYTAVEKPPVIVKGQRMAVYVTVATLTGRRGTFVIRWRMEFVGAGDGNTVGTGTWSLVRGTGAYAGAFGGGRVAAVAVTPRGFTSSQYEGVVRVTDATSQHLVRGSEHATVARMNARRERLGHVWGTSEAVEGTR